MSLKLVGGDIVFVPAKGPSCEGAVDDNASATSSQSNDEPITVISGKGKRCFAFGTILGGLIVVLREGSSDGSLTNPVSASHSRDSKRKGGKNGGKNASGASSTEKRTLSVCSFDKATASIQFLTHISVDGWSSLVVSPISSLVVLSDYDTAHSEVLEWQSASKTLRRVWEGRGSCPHIFNKGKDVLLLLYSARKFSLCTGRTMKEIDECSARSRELDIVDVLACEEYAFVVYENGACSVFEVTESTVRRVIDLGKVLGGSMPTGVALVDDTACMIVYSDDHDEVCFLNPMTVGNKNTFEKSTDKKALFRKNIALAEAQKASLCCVSTTDEGENEDEAVNRSSTRGSGESRSEKNGRAKTSKKESTDSKIASNSSEGKRRGSQRARVGSDDEDNNNTTGHDGEGSEGGIGLVSLLAISALCMATTALVVVKLAGNKK